MIRNFFTLAVRNFIKNRTYTVINICGLSIGLAAFILLSLFVRYQNSWDSFHKNSERIYRVQQFVSMANGRSEWTQIPAPFSNELQNKIPEIEESISIREVWGEYLGTSKENSFYVTQGFYANADIFDLFSFEFIEGTQAGALIKPFDMVLTKTLANKIFGRTNVVGEQVLGDNNYVYTVTAVVKDFPFNANVRPEYLTPYLTYTSKYGVDFFEQWNRHDTRVYVRLKENANKRAVETKITSFFDDYIPNREEELRLNPIEHIKTRNTTTDATWIAVLIYGIIGVVTLLLAIMNFVNLTTAYSMTRAKEIGVKKSLGVHSHNLIIQLLSESIILVFISLLLAFTWVEFGLPLFSRTVDLPLELNYIADWSFIVFIAGITLLTGIIGGLYPALRLSDLNPVSALKSADLSSAHNKGISVRKALVTFQLVLSVSFVIAAAGLYTQLNFLKNINLGFDHQTHYYCYIQANNDVKVNDVQTLFSELKEIAMVDNMSISHNSPFHGSWGRNVDWEGGAQGEEINCRHNAATASFIPTFGIELVSGRNFNDQLASDSSACIVNQTFINIVGWDKNEAIGKRIEQGQFHIIGVVRDFYTISVTNKPQPYVLFLHSNSLTDGKDLVIRMKKGYNNESIGLIKDKLQAFFPENIIEIKKFNDDLDANTLSVYNNLMRTFSFFSALLVLIAVIGLFALVSFSSRRKVKEIGIRKVHGATPLQIYSNLSREYVIMLIISIIIAIPLGLVIYYIDPSYHKQQISLFSLATIVLSATLITLLTISYQVLKVTRTNPVKSLRYE